jgi:hypothetical protein
MPSGRRATRRNDDIAARNDVQCTELLGGKLFCGDFLDGSSGLQSVCHLPNNEDRVDFLPASACMRKPFMPDLLLHIPCYDCGFFLGKNYFSFSRPR